MIQNENDVELIEAKPPDGAGPYTNFNLSNIDRGMERDFVRRMKYTKAYLWTFEGTRIITLCAVDKIQE